MKYLPLSNIIVNYLESEVNNSLAKKVNSWTLMLALQRMQFTTYNNPSFWSERRKSVTYIAGPESLSTLHDLQDAHDLVRRLRDGLCTPQTRQWDVASNALFVIQRAIQMNPDNKDGGGWTGSVIRRPVPPKPPRRGSPLNDFLADFLGSLDTYNTEMRQRKAERETDQYGS